MKKLILISIIFWSCNDNDALEKARANAEREHIRYVMETERLKDSLNGEIRISHTGGTTRFETEKYKPTITKP